MSDDKPVIHQNITTRSRAYDAAIGRILDVAAVIAILCSPVAIYWIWASVIRWAS